MATSVYNRLPSLGEADAGFIERDILSKLMPLFAAYQNFAVCLVHRHCSLKEGERMVSTGNVTQPERKGQSFPSSWLATGEPFEFNSEQTASLPTKLLDQFNGLIGEANTAKGIPLLGIRCIAFKGRDNKILTERTEGRKSIVTLDEVDKVHSLGPTIPTCWMPANLVQGSTELTAVACCRCIVQGGVHVEIGCD
ncbi:hypothetical protein B0H34DRAFT_671445 [Crassisporium funariophilum]|nr:hypothetical protein B0H34DRAFT_671445 [Crassisporium funariophilum]